MINTATTCNKNCPVALFGQVEGDNLQKRNDRQGSLILLLFSAHLESVPLHHFCFPNVWFTSNGLSRMPWGKNTWALQGESNVWRKN